MPLAEARNQTLAVHRNQRALISGDRASVSRLIWTLLDNVIKYTPNDGYIELSVDETGGGTRVQLPAPDRNTFVLTLESERAPQRRIVIDAGTGQIAGEAEARLA